MQERGKKGSVLLQYFLPVLHFMRSIAHKKKKVLTLLVWGGYKRGGTHPAGFFPPTLMV